MVLIVKDNKGSLEGNVAVDGEANARVALKTTEAASVGVVGRTVVHELGVDSDLVVTDTIVEVGNILTALVGDVATNVAVLLGRANVGPVVVDNGVGQQQERGASVGNTIDRGADKAVVADLVAGRVEAPVPGGVGGSVDDFTLVLRVVNVAKVVGSSRLVVQVGSEQLLVELGLDVAEPRLLLVGSDGVDAVGSKAEQTRSLLGALGKLIRYMLGVLDRLLVDSQAANRHLVKVHVSAAVALVSVANAPAGTLQLARAGRLVGRVVRVAVTLAAGSFAGEHPQIRGASVKVKAETLGGSANVNGRQVLQIIALGDGAGLSTASVARLVLGFKGALNGLRKLQGHLLGKLVEGAAHGQNTVGLELSIVLDGNGDSGPSSGRSGTGKASGQNTDEESTKGLHFNSL